MSNRNIQMKKKNDTGEWDSLFPVTMDTNVFDENGKSVASQLADIPINVKLFGVVGDGVADDTIAFQNALDLALDGKVKLLVPFSIYKITDVLQIHENTTIICDEGAIFKRLGVGKIVFTNGKMDDDDYSYGYDGDGNIIFMGGTIDLCGVENPVEKGGTNAFAIAHAENVHIENVTMKNNFESHFIEFNSTKNGKIINCIFDTLTYDGTGGYEMVQIDFSYQAGFPFWGGYDYTPCKDILIEGCTFKNGQRGVGSHKAMYNDEGEIIRHENIKIVNNTIENLTNIAIKPESYSKSIVGGNVIKDVGSHGVHASACIDLVISNNFIDNTDVNGIRVTKVTDDGFDERSKNITITANHVKKAGNLAYNIEYTDNVILNGNMSDDISNESFFSRSSTKVSVKNNTFLGSSQDAEKSAVNFSSSSDCDFVNNTVNNEAYPSLYNYALYIAIDSERIVALNNNLARGTLETIGDRGIDSEINSEFKLTENMNVGSGEITLKGDIRNFKKVMVVTGDMGAHISMAGISRCWITADGFRVDKDIITVATHSGKFVAEIISNNKIKIVQADDNFIYMIGIQ